jgi:benzoylformate decarboxylase
MVEQLAASGVKYIFYNSGSREARFFDALQTHPDIHGILALHEGNVASMAGGYAQAALEPGVMVVHLGAGLAQCMGQLYNIWLDGLPVVVITFAGDTGSFADTITLDLSHNVGPTAIAQPLTKASWTVLEPEGLPQAIDRALRVAMTPPLGPVHLAVYDKLLDDRQITTDLILGKPTPVRIGRPADEDVAAVAKALHQAKRPLFYVGDGIWKRGAIAEATALAEHFGMPVVGNYDEHRSVDRNHPLHIGRLQEAADAANADLILCVGVTHRGQGRAADLRPFLNVDQLIAVGASGDRLRNIPGLDLAIIADEKQFLSMLLTAVKEQSSKSDFAAQLKRTTGIAGTLREQRMAQLTQRSHPQDSNTVSPIALANAIDSALARRGGGQLMVEQYAVPLDCMDSAHAPDTVKIFRAGGASEGWGVGATIGTKLGAPDEPVIGLVGDGSLYYSDSGLWTAVHHKIPLLYVISNNQAYGIVASAFSNADGAMKQSGVYSGVSLATMDPVQIASGFGIEGKVVTNEHSLAQALEDGLNYVDEKQLPYLLEVRLPHGLPNNGEAAQPFQLG